MTVVPRTPPPPRRGLSPSRLTARCPLAPPGWWCALPAGHTGVCAAWPDEEPDSIVAPRWRLTREVPHGALLPRGYGVAWLRWDVDAAVCLPIPLNVAAAAVRAAWFWFKRGGRAVPGLPYEAYEAGRRDGLAQARRIARMQMQGGFPPWH